MGKFYRWNGIVKGLTFYTCQMMVFLAVAPGRLPAQPSPTALATPQSIEKKWGPMKPEEIKKAATDGNPEAQYYVATMDLDRARAANSQAFRWLAKAGGPEMKPPTDAAAKAKWGNAQEDEVRKAAQGGDREAQQFLGTRDSAAAHVLEEKAFALLLKAADQSLPVAENEAGFFYFIGGPVEGNSGKAADWFRKAAGHGYEPAEHQLAVMILKGEGTTRDVGEAITWLRKCTDQGCARAKFDLSQHYAAGNADPRSPKETPVALLRQAMEQQLLQATIGLADRYRVGLGVQRDFVESVLLYRAVRELRTDEKRPRIAHPYRVLFGMDEDDETFSRAEKVLADADTAGEPTARDDSEEGRFTRMAKLCAKAIDAKDAVAQSRIGELYAGGSEDVPQDSVAAYAWYSAAADGGSTSATATWEKLNLSSDQKSEAHRRQAAIARLIARSR